MMERPTDFGRVRPIAAGESADDEVNGLLRDAEHGWWQDPRMWGVFAHVPEAFTAWVQMIMGVGLYVDPVHWELMALRGAFVTGCHY